MELGSEQRGKMHGALALPEFLKPYRYFQGADGKPLAPQNIIGFLSNQNHEFSATTTNLADAQKMLGTARVRNYDIPTALSVLTKGTYDGLPTALQAEFATSQRMPDADVARLLSDMNGVLRWRLSCVEAIPVQMGKYSIGTRLHLLLFHVTVRGRCELNCCLRSTWQRMAARRSPWTGCGKRAYCTEARRTARMASGTCCASSSCSA